jgi:RNA polymerase sigma-70 factor (ECF subfamily)
MITSQQRGEPDDVSIVRRIARGEEQALAELYDRYSPFLYGLGMRILKLVPDAEDVVQDVFMQAWSKADIYRPEKGSVYTWLVMMTRSRAIDRLRSRESRQSGQFVVVDLASLRLFDEPSSSTPPSHAVRIEDQKLVLDTLRQLSIDQRQVLALAYYEGFTLSEIARILNSPPAEVKSRMRKGLQSMHSILKRKI